MKDVLVRGLSPRIHRQIQKWAEARNLSVNQALVQLIVKALEHLEEGDEREKERAEVFKRVRRLREEIRRKYGRQEDSTKLVREDRDSH